MRIYFNLLISSPLSFLIGKENSLLMFLMALGVWIWVGVAVVEAPEDNLAAAKITAPMTNVADEIMIRDLGDNSLLVD